MWKTMTDTSAADLIDALCLRKSERRGVRTGALAVAVLALGLAGCQQNKEVASPPLINGKWASSDNVYTAEFNNGRFVATANDTGGTISEGNYVLIDDDKVQINWFGVVSGRNNSADCVKIGGNRLNCTDANGQAFSLLRL